MISTVWFNANVIYLHLNWRTVALRVFPFDRTKFCEIFTTYPPTNRLPVGESGRVTVEIHRSGGRHHSAPRSPPIESDFRRRRSLSSGTPVSRGSMRASRCHEMPGDQLYVAGLALSSSRPFQLYDIQVKSRCNRDKRDIG